MISKAVNSTIEEELRDAAMEGRKTLAKKGASSSQKKWYIDGYCTCVCIDILYILIK